MPVILYIQDPECVAQADMQDLLRRARGGKVEQKKGSRRRTRRAHNSLAPSQVRQGRGAEAALSNVRDDEWTDHQVPRVSLAQGENLAPASLLHLGYYTSG